MRIYLDVSCLNRPFDDQSQPRIRLESEAVTIILGRIDQGGTWLQVSSRVAQIEIQALKDPVRRKRVLDLLPDDIMELGDSDFTRARFLVSRGIGAADALHVAAAESLEADVFLTCDDRLLRRCERMRTELAVKVANPLDWLSEQNDAADT